MCYSDSVSEKVLYMANVYCLSSGCFNLTMTAKFSNVLLLDKRLLINMDSEPFFFVPTVMYREAKVDTSDGIPYLDRES